jgi:taurine dioxygenase
LDLGSGLSPEQLTAVEQALVEHKVLFFRDQSMTAAGHQRFASWFGKLERHPAFPHVDGYPEVTVLESGRENRSKIERWHSDMTYLACPPLGSILRARVVPESGGDTLWLDAEAAWQALPVALRERLAPMQAEHSFAHGYRESLAEPGGRRRLAAAVAANPPLSHPVMRTHPASGRPSLFVNSLFTTRLLGLEEAESRDLLGRLFEHLENPDFQCRFVWEVNSVAFWDNRCTQHRPDKDWWPAPRRHERTTIEGDRPR